MIDSIHECERWFHNAQLSPIQVIYDSLIPRKEAK